MFRTFIRLQILIVILLSSLSIAQEWNEVTDAELQMKSIKEDPEANAVILFDKGELKINTEFDMEMSVHVRIKILTEVGKEYTNISIPFYYKDEIYDVEAYSYSPDGEEFELDDDDIFEEQEKSTKRIKFAIPGVVVGSVVEYRYELRSPYIHSLEPWVFQGNEFTRFSSVTVYLPPGFSYSAVKSNLDMYNLIENREKARDPFNSDKTVGKYTWSVRNLPGIKEEPYMTRIEDYYAKILFQLTGFKNQWNNIKIAKTWDDISKSFWNTLDDYVNMGGDLEDFSTDLVKEIKDPQEKIKKIYEYVCKDIKISDNNGFYGDDYKDPEMVLSSKSGSSIEQNILLINLLNHAGFQARPLIVSTRSNGRFNPGWVQAQQFNRVITYLDFQGTKWFLNPSEKKCPMGYLTPGYDVGIGFLLEEDKGKIIDITPLKADNYKTIKSKITLHENGTLYGMSSITYGGIRAINERKRIDEEEIRTYLEKELEKINENAVLDSFLYTNENEIDLPLELELTYNVPEYAEGNGDILYFSPPFITAIEKNPFVRERRSFPVDYSYAYTISEAIEINIPRNYSISDEPKPYSERFRNFSFSKTYFSLTDVIKCKRKLEIKRKSFHPGEYQHLREIYGKIVSSDQEQFVISTK